MLSASGGARPVGAGQLHGAVEGRAAAPPPRRAGVRHCACEAPDLMCLPASDRCLLVFGGGSSPLTNTPTSLPHTWFGAHTSLNLFFFPPSRPGNMGTSAKSEVNGESEGWGITLKHSIALWLRHLGATVPTARVRQASISRHLGTVTHIPRQTEQHRGAFVRSLACSCSARSPVRSFVCSKKALA